jgi:hypothetical protein
MGSQHGDEAVGNPARCTDAGRHSHHTRTGLNMPYKAFGSHERSRTIVWSPLSLSDSAAKSISFEGGGGGERFNRRSSTSLCRLPQRAPLDEATIYDCLHQPAPIIVKSVYRTLFGGRLRAEWAVSWTRSLPAAPPKIEVALAPGRELHGETGAACCPLPPRARGSECRVRCTRTRPSPTPARGVV